MNKIENPARLVDPWAPHFEVGGGCWLYRHDNRCFTVSAIQGEQITFVDGANTPLILMVDAAAKLMRPT